MSFEYELRPPLEADLVAAIASLEERFRARGAASDPAFGDALSIETEAHHTAVLYTYEDRLLLVIETLATLRLCTMRELLAGARSNGFTIHDEGDDTPLDWSVLLGGSAADAEAGHSR